jgi:hypothetical protein
MKELSHDTKQSSWRFELKYRISAYEYHKIRIAILSIHYYGLRWVANSKFTQGLQAARKDLYHPGDIVIIR